MKTWRVGIAGATGMVGQRLVSLLADHPWFRLSALAASQASAGKPYALAVGDRWALPSALPAVASQMTVFDASDVNRMAREVDVVFCAVSLPKEETLQLEESYAKAELPVISCNSAARTVADIPMIIPEINAAHADVIPLQKKRLGTKRGFIAVKPNCSIQSYVPALTPLRPLGLKAVSIVTMQAVSGAGKTLRGWPEMADNLIPFIPGEERKSEEEPLKIWGRLSAGERGIVNAPAPVISAQCIRVPVSDGHTAAVSVSFDKKPPLSEVRDLWHGLRTLPQELGLPSAPDPYLIYTDAEDRPQPQLDRDAGRGMAISVGRLREDRIFDMHFICLSHNTLRGAAGGSVLMAELLCAQGYVPEGGS